MSIFGGLTQLFDDLRRENARRERSTEDGVELVVQPTDSHLLEVPIGIDYGWSRSFPSEEEEEENKAQLLDDQNIRPGLLSLLFRDINLPFGTPRQNNRTGISFLESDCCIRKNYAKFSLDGFNVPVLFQCSDVSNYEKEEEQTPLKYSKQRFKPRSR